MARSKAEVALIIGLCVIVALSSLGLLDDAPHSPRYTRRYLKADDPDDRARRAAADRQPTSSAAYRWAEDRLRAVSDPPEPSHEVAMFWHVPKAGGSTATAFYQCLGLSLSKRTGVLPKFSHDRDEGLVVFHPWKNNVARYVNTDTTTPAGILKAEQWGLVPSGLVDMIFTTEPALAVSHLYDAGHRGRAMGLFRHPVDRLVSKFYYLQVATWERAYAPHWKNMDVETWARLWNNEDNFLVKKLAGKKNDEHVDKDDLHAAIRTVQRSFVVGLMDQMQESIHRFNVVMGIDESEEENAKCMERFFGDEVEKYNSNPHSKLLEGDPAWAVLAEKNDLDVRLYRQIVKLFNEQKAIIESYNITIANQGKLGLGWTEG